jgi:hypothetical protein
MLSHSEILVHIINEESRCASGSTLLNVARTAPIKIGEKKKVNHSSLTCHYC